MDVVTLLGPPGSGKSTLAEVLLARYSGVRVFRLREFTHEQAATDRVVARALTVGRDPLGWLPDAVAVLLVKRALERYAADGGVLLLEGYPGTPAQSRAFAEEFTGRDCGGGAIELAASDTVLRERVGRRLMCPVCDPRRRRPAERHADRPTGCRSCGTTLERRADDAPERFPRRLARYRHLAPPTCAALRAGGLPWHTVDADRDQPFVEAAALDVFRSLIPAQPRTKGQV
ncbi:nucleoside monophosphate kinase [Streptomyces sp. NPDC004539]|uniref:nucleoside monophosphate kinase n=1 Tax=Streptomyces sp. NPDC004539 TaxID=3154280 RepID=UPI0033BB34D9